MQSTYTWSRNLGIIGEVGRTFTDPRDRHADYALLPNSRTHDFRTNGTFALPFGPNRAFFTGASGVMARLIEDWSMSWIVNLSSGDPISIVGRNPMYADAVRATPDVVGAFDIKGKVNFPANSNSGNYWMGGNLVRVSDPQCATVTSVNTLSSACTLNAIADATTGQILLQNAPPGRRGTLGMNSLQGPGRWRFDANLAKSFRVSETKALQFRLDATNVFNHPEPDTPVLDINNADFGLITGVNAKSQLRRQFQAQLRFTF
jgi:hypothetical protein